MRDRLRYLSIYGKPGISRCNAEGVSGGVVCFFKRFFVFLSLVLNSSGVIRCPGYVKHL